MDRLRLINLGRDEAYLLLADKFEVDISLVATGNILRPVGAILLDALLGILVKPGARATLLLPHRATHTPCTLHIARIFVRNLGRQDDLLATLDDAIQPLLDLNHWGVVGLLVLGRQAPMQTRLKVAQGGLQPLAQGPQAHIAIDILKALDLVESTAPTAIGRILIGTQTIRQRIEEGRCIALADEGLNVEFTQRILAVLEILTDEVVAVGHRAVVPAATEVVAQKQRCLRVVALDVVARTILIPDAVHHHLAHRAVILLGILLLELVEGSDGRVATAPALDEYRTRILLQKNLHETIRAGRVGPIRGVD